ncbi:MAG: hypothetical protein LIO79_07450 [Rikenellaceae bacterium]|nr:hypothetical protein [Rikenellaceae bacterium]
MENLEDIRIMVNIPLEEKKKIRHIRYADKYHRRRMRHNIASLTMEIDRMKELKIQKQALRQKRISQSIVEIYKSEEKEMNNMLHSLNTYLQTIKK